MDDTGTAVDNHELGNRNERENTLMKFFHHKVKEFLAMPNQHDKLRWQNQKLYKNFMISDRNDIYRTRCRSAE